MSRERKAKGVVVYKEETMYKDNMQAAIVVINYDGLMYATEFGKYSNGLRGEKVRLAKSTNQAKCVTACQDRVEQNKRNGWSFQHSVFGGIAQKAKKDSVNNFLDKYG